MGNFDCCLELLSLIGRKGATRSALERCKQGFFADKIDSYVQHGIIRVEKNNDTRDDKFYMTALGLKLWQQKISIKDIERSSK